jgi:hypothetical protein
LLKKNAYVSDEKLACYNSSHEVPLFATEINGYIYELEERFVSQLHIASHSVREGSEFWA